MSDTSIRSVVIDAIKAKPSRGGVVVSSSLTTFVPTLSNDISYLRENRFAPLGNDSDSNESDEEKVAKTLVELREVLVVNHETYCKYTTNLKQVKFTPKEWTALDLYDHIDTMEPQPVIDFDVSTDDDEEIISRKRDLFKLKLRKRKRRLEISREKWDKVSRDDFMVLLEEERKREEDNRTREFLERTNPLFTKKDFQDDTDTSPVIETQSSSDALVPLPYVGSNPLSPTERYELDMKIFDFELMINILRHCTRLGYSQDALDFIKKQGEDRGDELELMLYGIYLKYNYKIKIDIQDLGNDTVRIVTQSGSDEFDVDYSGIYPEKDFWSNGEHVDDSDPFPSERMKKIYSFGASSLKTVNSFRETMADVLDGLDVGNTPVYKKYISIVEDIAMFYYMDMPRLNSKTETIVCLYRLSKAITGFSVCSSLYGWVHDMIQEINVKLDLECQAGEEPIGEVTYVDKFFKGEAFCQLQKLVCALSTVAMSSLLLQDPSKDEKDTDTKNIFKQIWEYFRPLLKKKMKWNILDTVFEFCKWLVSRGMELIKGEKTFQSIFFDEDVARSFDERIAGLEFMKDQLECGKGGDDALPKYMFEVLNLETIAQKEFDMADNKIMRVTLQRQLQLILHHKSEVLRMYESEAIRPSPFAILLSGTTSVGKTVVTSLIIPQLQKAMGIKEGPEYVFNFDSNDKYMSGVSPEHNTITLDDIGNTNPQFAEKNASDFIVYLINNYRRYALKADVETKGKIPLRPDIVVGSTNVAEVHSQTTSVEPLSIMRRFEYHLTVKVKESCGVGPPGKQMLKRTNHDPNDHNYDCWDICFYRYVPSHDNAVKMIRSPVEGLQNVSISTAMQFLVGEAKRFKLNQTALTNKMKNTHKETYCKHSIFEYLCQDCLREERETAVENLPLHLQVATMGGHDNFANQFVWNMGNQADRFGAWLKANSVAKAKVQDKDKPAFSIGSTAKFLMAFSLWKRQKITRWQTAMMVLGGVAATPIIWLNTPLYCAMWLTSTLGTFSVTSALRIARYMRLKPYDTMVEAVAQVRRDWKKTLKGLVPIGIVIGASFAAYKAWKYYKESQVDSQGGCVSLPIPKGVSGKSDPYRPPAIEVPIVNIDFKTATSSQMANVVQNKLALMRFKKGDKYHEYCVSLPLCTGYWFVPMHVLNQEYDSVDVVRYDTLHTNASRNVRIAGAWKQVGKTDFALMYIPALGDQRDLRKLFPDGDKLELKGSGARCIWLKPEKKDDFIHLERGEFKTNIKTEFIRPHNLEFGYHGGNYRSTIPTWKGMCGSVLLTDVNGPTIVGLHSAGAEGTTEARTCTILRKDIDLCISSMTGDETSQLLGVQSGNFAECLDFKGTPFEYIPTIRPKATSSFVDCGSFSSLGSFKAPHRTFRSAVKPTLVADSICEEFGVEVKHGGPRYINHWAPWNVWVTAMSNPSDIPVDIIDQAYLDYKKHISDNWQPDWEERISPMADDAVLAGIDGLKGCYAMNFKSSMGIPYCKPKGNFITPSERVVENITCPRDMPDHLKLEIEKMERELAKGNRVYTPHRCSLKDEPTKLEKDKVRLFMGSAFAYQFLMRKYFLMLSVIIQEHPELFESAVGVRAASPEWTRLYNYIFKHGINRCIAGDFAKYDQKMDIKIVFAAFKLYFWILKRCGYTEEQLTICRGLATETCMAIYDVRNELMQFNCGVTSGNPLTVVLNSTGNSLMMRCVKEQLKPKYHLSFREMVALMTYGDDNTMSVKPDEDWFNHTAIAQVFSSWGMEYTMADKTALSVPFIDSDQVEFLKRKWVWSDKYQRHLCPLNEDSIIKSLTCALKSDMLTPEQHSAEIVAGANLEYWFHGKEVFDKRHDQLESILRKKDIVHHLPKCRLVTYEEIEEWYLSN